MKTVIVSETAALQEEYDFLKCLENEDVINSASHVTVYSLQTNRH